MSNQDNFDKLNEKTIEVLESFNKLLEKKQEEMKKELIKGAWILVILVWIMVILLSVLSQNGGSFY
jgi:hypothetical protein